MHRDGERLVIEPVRKATADLPCSRLWRRWRKFPEIDDPIPASEQVYD